MGDRLYNYGTLQVNQYCTDANITIDPCKTANTNYPDISSNTVFDLEKKIVENINDINRKYSVLLRCTDVSGNYNGLEYRADITPCDSTLNTDTEKTNLQNLISKTNNLVQVYNELINTSATTDDASPGVNPNTYNTNYKNIIQQYNNNLKLRTDLDLKLQELMQGDKSVSGLYKRSNETMVYTNVIWTVLASSFVYYIFVNLT
jgi:hypothetical protein